MKVQGSAPTAPSASRTAPQRAAADGFSPVGGSGPAAAAARAAPVAALASLEALLALQEAPSPTERRRRAVKRGGAILDALDELRLAALDPGGVDAPVLERLAVAVRQTRDGLEDPALDALLDEIDLRAAVELAKREGVSA